MAQWWNRRFETGILSPFNRWFARASRREFFLAVVLSGMLVRLFLAPYSGVADLSTFSESSTTMVYGGGPYTYLIVYPPGWVYLLDLIGRVTTIIVPATSLVTVPNPILPLRVSIYLLEPTSLPNPAYAIAEKVPLFVFDFLVALLLHQFALEAGASKSAARWAFVGFFLNPFVIFVSAVHGAYDVLPALMILASFYLALHGRGFSAGVALGLGVITKVFPVFFLPLLAAVLWRHREPVAARTLMYRRYAAWTAGILAMVALVFWPAGLLQGYFSLVSVGPTLGQNHGGFGIWSWVQVPSLSPIRWTLYANTGLVMILTTTVAFILAIVVAGFYLKRTKTGEPDGRWMYAFTATSFVTLIAFASVQPQYLMWILPGMILVAAVDRRFRSSLVIVSAAGLIFYFFGLAGPLYFFQPLAAYTTVLSWSTVTNSILNSLGIAGWIALVSTVLGSVILAWVGIRAASRINPLRPTE